MCVQCVFCYTFPLVNNMGSAFVQKNSAQIYNFPPK